MVKTQRQPFPLDVHPEHVSRVFSPASTHETVIQIVSQPVFTTVAREFGTSPLKIIMGSEFYPVVILAEMGQSLLKNPYAVFRHRVKTATPHDPFYSSRNLLLGEDKAIPNFVPQAYFWGRILGTKKPGYMDCTWATHIPKPIPIRATNTYARRLAEMMKQLKTPFTAIPDPVVVKFSSCYQDGRRMPACQLLTRAGPIGRSWSSLEVEKFDQNETRKISRKPDDAYTKEIMLRVFPQHTSLLKSLWEGTQ